MKILFCKITWMENYIGREYEKSIMPFTGGKYVDEYKVGGEELNFLDIDGYCYGFVETKSNKNRANKLHIEKLEGISEDADKAEEVLVVWVAKNKNEIPEVIGWYKNAIVYSHYQNKLIKDYGFNIKARAEDCILLPLNKRILKVPHAGHKGISKGAGFGQANVWYALNEEAKPLVKKVVKFIEEYDGERINKFYTESELDSLSKLKFDKIDDYYKKINEYLDEKQNDFIKYQDYLAALQLCNSIIAFNNKEQNALFLRGFCLMGLFRYQKAINIFEKYNELYPDEYETNYNLGVLYYELEEPDKAIKYFSMASEFSNEPFINYMLAETYYYKKDYSSALENYKICLNKDDKFVDAYYSIANIEYNIYKNAENAIKFYDKALEIDDEDLHALYEKAIILKEEKRIKEALQVINQALQIDKNNSWFNDLKHQITYNE